MPYAEILQACEPERTFRGALTSNHARNWLIAAMLISEEDTPLPWEHSKVKAAVTWMARDGFLDWKIEDDEVVVRWKSNDLN